MVHSNKSAHRKIGSIGLDPSMKVLPIAFHYYTSIKIIKCYLVIFTQPDNIVNVKIIE